MVGGVYGADVEQLRSLGKKFEVSKDGLLDVARLLDGLINTPQMWSGPDAERFRFEWNGRDRMLVARAAEALSEAAASLARNADEQEQASGAGGGLTGGTYSGGLQPSAPASGSPAAAGPALDERALIQAYHTLRQLEVGGLSVSDLGLLGADLVGGSLLDKVGLVADGADLVDAVNRGEWGEALGVLSKTAGDTIKDSVPTPVGYLTGTAINVWTDVFTQASKVDWSVESMQGTGNYAARDPWGAASAGAEAVVAYLPELVGNVLPAKFGVFGK